MSLSLKFTKIITCALTVSMLSLPLSAQTVARGEEKSAGSVSRIENPASMLTGILNAADADEVYVNGNRAKNGMTILSQTDLETRDSAASIALSDMGTIRVCPQTKMNLDFDNGRVEIKLISGNARLEINPNLQGTIYTADGTALKTDKGGNAATPNCRCVVETASELPLAALPGVFPLLGIFGGVATALLVGTQLNDEEIGGTAISVVVP